MVGGELLREGFSEALSAIKHYIKQIVIVGMGLAFLTRHG
jgi:hypothetical protein